MSQGISLVTASLQAVRGLRTRRHARDQDSWHDCVGRSGMAASEPCCLCTQPCLRKSKPRDWLSNTLWNHTSWPSGTGSLPSTRYQKRSPANFVLLLSFVAKTLAVCSKSSILQIQDSFYILPYEIPCLPPFCIISSYATSLHDYTMWFISVKVNHNHDS